MTSHVCISYEISVYFLCFHEVNRSLYKAVVKKEFLASLKIADVVILFLLSLQSLKTSRKFKNK